MPTIIAVPEAAPVIDTQALEALLMGPPPRTARDLLRLEERSALAGQQVADQVLACHLLKAQEDRIFVEQCVRAALSSSPIKLRRSGTREVTVRLSGGGQVELVTPYLEPDHSGRPGRRRAQGRHGPAGSGVYPVLRQLGVEERATPRVRFLAACQLVKGDCYRSALGNLEQMGLCIDNKALVRYGLHTAQALVALRDARLAKALDCTDPSCLPLAGKRVQVSIDGGRVQVRFNHTRGRRKSNGRRGFVTEWKEPKGFIIQVLDEHGRPDRKVLPFIDFTLGDCEAMFALLKRYLHALGASFASELVFISDGAEWIWNRLEPLIADLGVDRSKVMTLLDFFHAAEYLAEASRACTTFADWERKELFEGLRRYLRHGQLTLLFARLDELTDQFGADDLITATAYLKSHREHLLYRKARERKLPIGSGAIESAVRRVVNQRFKAPGTTWSSDTIEPLLHLRALVICGRFDDACQALLTATSFFEGQPLTSATIVEQMAA